MSLNHYYLESMARHKQLEIEKQARESWKFIDIKDNKEIQSIEKLLKTTEKSVIVAAPSSCCCEC
ncbi:hypothetical protein PP175_02210 [Aneurinibacillus sp. Ricciae_BoGa-3]|uniref:hypothetical protein n=1 Tax=Aneurinibacillus sp. Ricciae_BoGa-3 TaxID=3022697 RepID=UPI0023413EFC|nr:hypothetical protein [Aneurinibacillus sp. Ricciae_BoGa-3]WCK54851.1 hypothetical protein PP175_02210 [Aneurinibacillus sp. Ricciae_BoGa-3]